MIATDNINNPRTMNAIYSVGDRLKAVLTNCQRHRADGQNRDGHTDFRAHLQGRVAWAESVAPTRGAKLRALFDAIDWSAERE